MFAHGLRERAPVLTRAASVREIDTYNIYHASSRAIRRAVSRLPQRPDHVVLDGDVRAALFADVTAARADLGGAITVTYVTTLVTTTRT